MSRVRRSATWAAGFALVGASCSSGGDEASPSTTDLFSPDVGVDLDDDGNAALDETSEPAPGAVPTGNRPGIDPLTCGSLFDVDDADIALGLTELPFAERDVLQFAQGEICGAQYADDDSRGAVLEPGLPSDLEPDATILGAAGTPVYGVGDAAAWFETRTEGTLAVQQATDLGQLNFRLTLSRPDIDGSARREAAIEVARRVLPRFPGVDPLPPPEFDLAANRGALDRSSEDVIQRLFDGEASGAWSRGEGLVALLSALTTGQGGAADGIEGWAQSGTGLVALARQYVSESSDDLADELTQLLATAFPTRERLEASTPTTTTTTVPDTSTTVAVSGFRRSTPPPCAEPIDGSCTQTFRVDELDAAYGDGKYLVWVPTDDGDFGPWPKRTVDAIIEAFTESAHQFEEMGAMPTTDLALTNLDGSPSMSNAAPELCSIVLRTSALGYAVDQIQQFVAGEMAHCFLAATFTAAHGGNYQPATWWSGGLAIWLSTIVYPKANLEWVHLAPALADHELHTSVFDRVATNWMFFQHLHWEYGADQVLDYVGKLPPDIGNHPTVVSTWREMDSLYHDFVESLSDRGVPDSGSNPLSGWYKPVSDFIEVDAPISVLDNVDAFRVGRVELDVLGGRTACIDAEAIDGAQLTWRRGNVRESGDWSSDLPTSLRRTATFAASSTTDGGAFRITVTDIVDSADDCETDEESDGDSDGGSSGGEFSCEIECGPSLYFSLP